MANVIGEPLNSESFDSVAPACLKLGRILASSPLPSRLCLLCRFSQRFIRPLGLAHLCCSRPRGFIREWVVASEAGENIDGRRASFN